MKSAARPFRVLLGLLTLAAATGSARATWWDAMPLKWTEPPLVVRAEGEAIPNVTGGAVVADKMAFGGKALRLDPGSSLLLNFKGVHSHYRFIGIMRVEGAPETASKEPLPPIWVTLRVAGPAGDEGEWTMRLGYRGVYTDAVDFFFPAYRDGEYRCTLTLDKQSAGPVLLDWVEVRDLFGDCVRKPIKSGRRLLSDAQVAQMRAEAAAKGPVARPRDVPEVTKMAPADREAWFDRIWASPPPRNAYVMDNGEKGVRWDLPPTPWNEPWGFMDPKRKVVYTVADFRAGRLTGTAHDENGWGYVAKTDKGEHVYSWMAYANHYRWTSLLLSQVDRLTDAWLAGGDPNVGWAAVALLAAVTDKWPDLDSAAQMRNPIYGGGKFSHTWRPGKLGHNFWDLGHCEDLNKDYDALFPLIRDNDELARLIGRHVAWVKTPADAVEYFDVQLVQHTYDLMQRGVVGSSGRIPKAKLRCAILLGPSALSEKIMDELYTQVRSDLSGFYGGLAQQLIADYTRDGSSHTDGGGYAKGQAASLLDIAELTHRYVQLGGNERFDLLNLDRFPFMRAAMAFPIIYRVAGGYVPGLGDWGRPWRPREFTYDKKDDGPEFRRVYQLGWERTADPMFAWLLVHTFGRIDEDDATWQRLTAAAAKIARHPLLSLPPRVLHGYGLAILADGTRFDDFTKKSAALLRFGWALGHGHADTLNLDLYAHGCRVAPDMGSRQNRPNPRASRQHCVVEVDGHSFGTLETAGSAISATGWLTDFHAAPDVQFTAGEGRSDLHPDVQRFERQVALIGVGEADSYVFDVFRVRGGKMHTWCFHGAPIDPDGKFEISVPLGEAKSDAAKAYQGVTRGWEQTEGRAADPLMASWTIGRKWQEVELGADHFDKEKTPPTTMRARLFGHANDLVMTADADPSQPFYGCRMRFLYVQRQAADNLSTVWPAVYEPIHGRSPLADVRRIDLGDRDDSPVAVAVATAAGRRDLCYADRLGGAPRSVEGVQLAGTFAFWSQEKDGRLARMMVVGGGTIGNGAYTLSVEQVEHVARVEDIDYAAGTLRLDRAWPALLAGEQAAVHRRGPENNSYELRAVDGRTAAFKGGACVFQSYLKRVDADGALVPEMDPPAMRADSRYYEGMHLGGPDGKAPWRVAKVAETGMTMYLGWPWYDRWRQKLALADLPDANQDGKRSLIMDMGDGRTVRLDVTYVSPDGFTFDFARPTEDYAPTSGWGYVFRKLVNEDGAKQWYGLYPGSKLEIRVDGAPAPSAAGLVAANGRALINVYDIGVGDELHVSTHASLARVADGVYELRANTDITVTLPGAGPFFVRTPGGAWRAATTAEAKNGTQLRFRAADLGGGIVQIASGAAARDAAPREAEGF